jgi:hypothetical protein
MVTDARHCASKPSASRTKDGFGLLKDFCGPRAEAAQQKSETHIRAEGLGFEQRIAAQARDGKIHEGAHARCGVFALPVHDVNRNRLGFELAQNDP